MSAASELKARNGQGTLGGMTMGHSNVLFTPSLAGSAVHDSRVAIGTPVRLLADCVQTNVKFSAA